MIRKINYYKDKNINKTTIFSITALFVLIYFFILSCTAFNEGSPPVSKGYGALVYSGKHSGIDYRILRRTPIIACSDGTVAWIRDPSLQKGRYGGGYYVFLMHEDEAFEPFYSVYAHLSKVFVYYGQTLKRGHLIGLSGASNAGFEHLHFGLHNQLGGGQYIYNTFDPNKWGLDGGKPEYFDPKKDYSKYSFDEITLPVPCGEYRKILRDEIKKSK